MKLIEENLRKCSDNFHKVLASTGARKVLESEGHKLPTKMHEEFKGRLLTVLEVDALMAEGFTLCVQSLLEMGAKDVSIHNCNPLQEEAPPAPGMDIRLYQWDQCPDEYKAFSPFTKHFFEEGHQVTLVGVVKNPNIRALSRFMDSYFLTKPTDSATGRIDDTEVKVMFWTKEAKR